MQPNEIYTNKTDRHIITAHAYCWLDKQCVIYLREHMQYEFYFVRSTAPLHNVISLAARTHTHIYIKM